MSSPEGKASRWRMRTSKARLIVEGDEKIAARATINDNLTTAIHAQDHATTIESKDEPVMGYSDSRKAWIVSRFRRRFKRDSDPGTSGE